MKKQENKFLMNNRRFLTKTIEVFSIFLAAFLGATLSFILVKMDWSLYLLVLTATVSLILIILLILFWDWYNQPARLQGCEQLITIETNTEDIKKMLERDELRHEYDVEFGKEET